ncbi:hypothetical protein B0T09DRAFT_336892 [Sordaria sp. MPI-SDFR-AT-0083]|nr:hypothetical protein B0T09DRAFT_336892 [Sordaria sp. MPI-SDFR-AT-0083]
MRFSGVFGLISPLFFGPLVMLADVLIGVLRIFLCRLLFQISCGSGWRVPLPKMLAESEDDNWWNFFGRALSVPIALISGLLALILKLSFDIAIVLFGILYALARIYLVVISFINLAHLSDSA